MPSGCAPPTLRARRSPPLRTCIGCRRVAPSSELVRVARRPDGSLAPGRAEPGRGAWLCSEPGLPGAASRVCFEAAARRRAFGRALRTEVGEDELARLRGKLMGKRGHGRGDRTTRNDERPVPGGDRKKE